jgi:hypothetical protein
MPWQYNESAATDYLSANIDKISIVINTPYSKKHAPPAPGRHYLSAHGPAYDTS